MTTSLVIGRDEGVLEGIAQALATAGHRVHVARSVAEAAAVLTEIEPLALVVERACASDPEFMRLRLPPGCADKCRSGKCCPPWRHRCLHPKAWDYFSARRRRS